MRCDHFHGHQGSPASCPMLNDEERAAAAVYPGRCPLCTSSTRIGQAAAPRCPRFTTLLVRAIHYLFWRPAVQQASTAEPPPGQQQQPADHQAPAKS